MELRELRYFWTVAEEKSFSKAAKVLHITQPTLSRQIRELEDKLGTELFNREDKQLSLTEEGYFLKERAAEILTLSENTEREFLKKKNQPLSGHFSIGCIEADNSDTMAMILEDLIRDYPLITFTIVTGTSDEISTKLEKGMLDVAILLEPLEMKSFEKILLPRLEKWGLLVSKESSLAEKKVIRPADLEGIPLLSSNRKEVKVMLEKWMHKPFHTLTIVGNYNLIFNVFSLVRNQIGAALALEGAMTDRNQKEMTFIPLFPEITSTCLLVWKKKRRHTPVVKELIHRFKQSFT